jgi:hypothetical protein
MNPKVTAPVVQDLIAAIQGFPAPRWALRDDGRLTRRLAPLQTILGAQARGELYVSAATVQSGKEAADAHTECA